MIHERIRTARVALAFALQGGTTRLARQYAGYPFHITRPFHLDAAVPQLATLYLQSASGGLYRGDDLAMAIAVEPGAAAAVTTQASTLVHDGHGGTARLATRADVGPGGFLALWPDPTILLPGASLAQSTDLTLAADASALVAESWLAHDPRGEHRRFASFATTTTIRDPAGRPLVAEHQAIAGAHWSLALGGTHDAAGSAYLLGPVAGAIDPAALDAALALPGVAAGTTALPNNAGLAVRILALDGVALTTALGVIWRHAFTAAFGCAPAPRRK